MIETELNFSPPALQQWDDPLFAEKRLQVSVLRLDAMHPVMGGNKWMKLRGFLQQALQQHESGILTKGGPWSNHLHACAWACQQLHLPLYAWVKGHEKMQSAMLRDMQQWGANLRFVNRTLFYDEAGAETFSAEHDLLYIPMGGAEASGLVESSRFLKELNLPRFNYAACSVGTATTFGGLAFVPDNFATVIGIDAGTNDEAVVKRIAGWQKELPLKSLILFQEFACGGFAGRTPELMAFANELYRQYLIPTDTVYTAKLFLAIGQLAGADYFAKGSSILVLHSGGLQGNRSLPTGTLEF